MRSSSRFVNFSDLFTVYVRQKTLAQVFTLQLEHRNDRNDRNDRKVTGVSLSASEAVKAAKFCSDLKSNLKAS